MHPKFKSRTLIEYQKIVAECEKQRFTLIHEESDANDQRLQLHDILDSWLIRANQGHSMSHIQVDMVELKTCEDTPVVVHGTFKANVESIRKFLEHSFLSSELLDLTIMSS